MKNENLVFWVLLAGCLAAGFISGWSVKDWTSGRENIVYTSGGIVKVHDTIKTPILDYRVIPGRDYNVDSLVDVVNQFWKDSLKNLYGKGLFEAKFNNQSDLGKEEITLESRVPIDPEAEVTLTEEYKLPGVYPERRFGINAGIGYELQKGFSGTVGVKYYVLDYKCFSLACLAGGRYFVCNKVWIGNGGVEAEIRF